MWGPVQVLSLLIAVGFSKAETLLNSLQHLLTESDRQLFPQFPSPSLTEEYDFIVVGAGTAGCTVASRLSEVPQWRILLIEAGGHEKFYTDIPVLVGSLQNTTMDWAYLSEPSDDYCRFYKNHQCTFPRGKVLGGSSVLNYMLATRGNRKDYDNWAAAGNPGWAYQDVLPYFRKAENITIPELKTDPFHSTTGPLSISHTQYHTKLGEAFLDAGRQLGHRIGDYNGRSQTSFSYFQFTQSENGRRSSNSRSYVLPVLKQRKNLDVLVNALVTRLIWGDRDKVIGVEVHRDGSTRTYRASKEVIVSAGAVNSPQVLMLSGIGPRAHLEEFNIPVRADLPVGLHLHDHVSFAGLIFTTNITDKELNATCIANNPKNVINYVERGYGPYAIPGGNEAVFFYDINSPYDPEGYPDLEIHFSTVSPIPEEKVRGLESLVAPIRSFVVFAMQPILMHPASRGRIELRSKDPMDKVKIIPNYFAEERDVQTILKGVHKVMEISKTPAFQKYDAQLFSRSVPGCPQKFGSDDYFACMMRETTITNYHQSGTCQMGPYGVVDERLKVRGVVGLRVVDASIMPAVPAAHTNIPTNMIAEKGSDVIKQDHGVFS